MHEAKLVELKKKLKEISKVISELDPAIRSFAFQILAPLYFEDGESKVLKREKGKKVPISEEGTQGDRASFYRSFENDKPSDNVMLITAWFYSQYGVYPVTSKEIVEEANDAGLTVPDRPDNTMRVAARDRKKLFRKRGNGWQLTVIGEAFLKENYKVKKGNKPRPSEKPE